MKPGVGLKLYLAEKVVPLFLPRKAWSTKGFDFWLLLAALLKQVRPQNILELGTGRSTLTMAEYASASGANFVSLETDPRWYSKAVWELRWVAIKRRHIHFIAKAGESAWYDAAAFDALIPQDARFDFAYIDAPNDSRGNSKGSRDSDTGAAKIRNVVDGAKVIVIDDVHRRHVFDSIDKQLARPEDYVRYYFDYPVKPIVNSLCLCVRKDVGIEGLIDILRDEFRIRIYQDFTADMCVEP